MLLYSFWKFSLFPDMLKRRTQYAVVQPMNWTIQYQLFILLGLILTGFGVCAWFLADFSKKFKKLFGGNADPKDTYTDLIRRVAALETKIGEAEPKVKFLEEISRVSIQKVGFLRFNPFTDTGGDQSFSLVLLDGINSGVIITSLYMRDGVRIYAKRVEQGKTKQQLSREEKGVLEETISR